MGKSPIEMKIVATDLPLEMDFIHELCSIADTYGNQLYFKA